MRQPQQNSSFRANKCNNRAVTSSVYSYEALWQFRFSEFLKWLQQKNHTLPDELWRQHYATKDILLSVSVPHSAINDLQNLVEEYVLPQMADCRAEASNMSPTGPFWGCFHRGNSCFSSQSSSWTRRKLATPSSQYSVSSAILCYHR